MGLRTAGIDIGSRTIELIIVNEEGQIIESLLADTGAIRGQLLWT
jgi:activator of 2-hydroxyglutaryl-CoA dehydratase